MVERALSMREAPGSIPGTSKEIFYKYTFVLVHSEISMQFISRQYIGDIAQW